MTDSNERSSEKAQPTLNPREKRLLAAAFVAASAVLALTAGLLPDGQVALLDSARTRAYFDFHYDQCNLNTPDPNAMGPLEYKRYWGGWEQVLKEMKQADPSLTYNIVDDTFVTTRLVRSSYKVLILSNNVALTPSQTDAIKQWVGDGGRLLATFGSGYEAAVDSVEAALLSKRPKNALQQLWGDPLSQFVTTGTLGTVPPPEGGYPPGSVEPIITRLEGPTAKICQFYDPANGTCPYYYPALGLLIGYGDLANVLVGRGETHPGVYAHFAFANNLAVFDPNNIWPDTEYNKPLPAVVSSTYRKGRAVYYAFAPEFIVGLEYDAAGHCVTDSNYPGESPEPGLQSEPGWDKNHFAGRTPELRALMKSSIDFLLKTP
jgi:hypothetical protein